MAEPKSPRPVWDPQLTRGVCEVLAQTDPPGLTNSEIDLLLGIVGIPARESGANKRDSLWRTLHNTQVREQRGRAFSMFFARAMNPARYAANPQRFTDLAAQLDEVLVHYGWRVGDDGRLTARPRARSMTEAAAMAGRLQTELRRRRAHEILLRYCSEELIARSLFHATSEAAKSLPARVRELSTLAGDGAALYDGAFGTGRDRPLLFINAFRTDSEISEHRGVKQLLIGVHQHYRNPRAHSSRIDATELEQDFFDAFSLFSYLHRRLDDAARTPMD